MEERKIRGQVPIGVVSYIEKRLDPERREAALSRLSAEVRGSMRDLARNKWYPAAYTIELYRAVAALNDDPQARYNELVECGRHLAAEATTTFLRLLIKLLTPAIFARKFPTFWYKDHNFGTVVADMSQFADKRITIDVSDVDGYDHIGPVCQGWVGAAFEAIGVKDVNIAEKRTPVTEATSSSYLYELTWS